METMFTGDNLAWLFLGALGLVLGWLIVRRFFSPDAMQRRRRARSHGSVVSKKQGVSVRLAVKMRKPKKNGRK